METDPRTLSIRDYTYPLPEEKIAKFPLPQRDASKLLIYEKESIQEDIYRNLATYVPEHSLLVFNDTKVIEARLLFQKTTGGMIEIFCLEPHGRYPDITTAMLQREKVLWQCLIGGASKWKHGQVLEKKIIQNGKEFILQARYCEKTGNSFTVELSWNHPSFCFAEILHLFGVIPLPPYLKREAVTSDTERYQTIYAQTEGSVAAPTAGLHFTPALFDALARKNIQKEFITLHVGAGTFQPVKCEPIQHHEMHTEYFTVTSATVQHLIHALDKKIVAVGTTTLRTLESLYWLGLKLSTERNPPSFYLSQWEAYQYKGKTLEAKEALANLLLWMQENQQSSLTANTRLLIAPGYSFKIVQGLVTNFHQPQSTLLLLVAAFIGKEWKSVYHYALQHEFRFLSYGDGSLLWTNQA